MSALNKREFTHKRTHRSIVATGIWYTTNATERRLQLSTVICQVTKVAVCVRDDDDDDLRLRIKSESHAITMANEAGMLYDGFKEDALDLIKAVVAHKSTDFRYFCDEWKRMGFHYVFM